MRFSCKDIRLDSNRLLSYSFDMALSNSEKQLNFRSKKFEAGESRVEIWISDNSRNAGDNDYSDRRAFQIALDALHEEMKNGRLQKQTYQATLNLWRPVLGEMLFEMYKIIE
jgi:hypothetical protein